MFSFVDIKLTSGKNSKNNTPAGHVSGKTFSQLNNSNKSHRSFTNKIETRKLSNQDLGEQVYQNIE